MAKASRKREFVTLIDGDNDLTRQLVAALNDAGYRVDVVHPEVAIVNPDALGDIVITEVMFGEDRLGPEVVRRIRSARTEVPIIVLSNESDWKIKIEMFEAGASDYITKPLHTEELLARVGVQLRRQALLGGLGLDRHTPSERLKIMSFRLNVVCSGLRSLRINSIGDQLERLEVIAGEMAELANGQPNLPQVRAETIRVLPVLGQIYDLLGSERGAQMLVSGAVAGLLSLGGWPAVTAYSLSMAAWLGKDAFIEAVKNLKQTD